MLFADEMSDIWPVKLLVGNPERVWGRDNYGEWIGWADTRVISSVDGKAQITKLLLHFHLMSVKHCTSLFNLRSVVCLKNLLLVGNYADASFNA